MRRVVNHFLRIDARSLGLFRIAMAIVLIADLFGRWRWLRDFYSNQGVLTNHNHLFHLLDKSEVWSALHAVSSPGEATVAFAFILFVYAGFLIGIHTRVFHVLALLSLVSLTGRNVLLENAGNYLAIGLLAVTALLPLGSRLSIDALRKSLASRQERTAADLNEQALPDEAEIALTRGAGYSPVSLAAAGALLLVASVYLVTAYRQGSEWRSGEALGRAVYWQAWAGDVAIALRGRGASILSGLTYFVYGCQWAIPALIFLPVFRRYARGVATVLAILHALVLGVLFDFGLYAWTFLAASLLFLSTEGWEAFVARRRPERACTVFYDADCGFCLWLSRVLKRLDARRLLTFQSNDDIDKLLVRKDGVVKRVKKPKRVTAELAADTIIVVDAERNVLTRGGAAAAIVSALPLGAPIGWLMRRPGLDAIIDVGYDFVASRRIRISVALGWEACGITRPEDAPPIEVRVSPARVLGQRVLASLREILAVAVVAMLAIQVSRNNDLPETWRLPEVEVLRVVATYGRLMERWDVLVPGVPEEQGVVVVDAQTRTGTRLDLLTGVEPSFDVLTAERRGQLWASYFDRLRDPQYEPFQKAFRDWLARQGGPGVPEDAPAEQRVAGFDLYWVSAPISPDAANLRSIRSTRLLRYSRGGKGAPPSTVLPRPLPGVPPRP